MINYLPYEVPQVRFWCLHCQKWAIQATPLATLDLSCQFLVRCHDGAELKRILVVEFLYGKRVFDCFESLWDSEGCYYKE